MQRNINFSSKPKHKLIKKEAINIALSIDKQVQFTDMNLSYENTLNYFGKNGHKEVSINSLKIIKKIENLWDFQDKISLSQTYKKTLSFHLRFNLNTILRYLYIIDSAIQYHRPSEIYISDDIEIFGRYEIFECILKSFIESNGLKIRIIKIPTKNKTHKIQSKILKNIGIVLLNFLTKLLLFFSRSYLNKKHMVIVADDTYGMLSLIRKLRDKTDFVPVFLNFSHKNLGQILKNFFKFEEFFFKRADFYWKDSQKLTLAKRKFKEKINLPENSVSFLNVEINNLISKYFLIDLYREISFSERNANFIEKVIGIYKPSLAISQHSVGYSYALGEIFSLQGLKSILISHGSHVPQDKDSIAYEEWRYHSRTILTGHYSHSLIQSPLASNFFKSLINAKPEQIQTAPIFFPKLNNFSIKSKRKQLIGEKNINKRVIIHASTPKGDNSFRPWIYETIDEYIGNINDLISAIDCLEETYLIIRFRPTELLSYESFNALIKKSKNIGIYCDKTFSEYLEISDILVSYSSTTIDEALFNKIPIILYDPESKYRHLDSGLLNAIGKYDAPAFYCPDRNLLQAKLADIISNFDIIEANKRSWEKYIFPNDEEYSWLRNFL